LIFLYLAERFSRFFETLEIDMQKCFFVGRVAKAVAVLGNGDKAVAKFTLITNEYAGKDEGGDARERVVAIPFTAFAKRAEALGKHVSVGDQLIVTYRVANNNYTDKEGKEQYGFEFILEEFEFGAPGATKREILEDLKRG
jgi:single-strand DNA-binding protein